MHELQGTTQSKFRSLSTLCVLATFAVSFAAQAQLSPSRTSSSSRTGATTTTRPQQVQGSIADQAPLRPVIQELRLWDPNTGRRIYGENRYQPEVAVEFIGSEGQSLYPGGASEFRFAVTRSFSGSTWTAFPADGRAPVKIPAKHGSHTLWVQVRSVSRSANGLATYQTSDPRSFTLNFIDPVVQAEAELSRLGCSYLTEFDGGTPVVNLRCPLSDLVAAIGGLDSLKIDLEREGSLIESRFNLSGTVQRQSFARSQKLGVIKPVDAVYACANGVRTQSTSVSVSENTIRLRIQFESAGTEFLLALKAPGKAPCLSCLPDLQWDNAAFTVNVELTGDKTSLDIAGVTVTDLGGTWDIGAGLGASAAATLSGYGINGPQALLDKARARLTQKMQSEVNSMVSSQTQRLRAALQNALRAGFGDSGTITVGYQPYNNSVIATYRL